MIEESQKDKSGDEKPKAQKPEAKRDDDLLSHPPPRDTSGERVEIKKDDKDSRKPIE